MLADSGPPKVVVTCGSASCWGSPAWHQPRALAIKTNKSLCVTEMFSLALEWSRKQHMGLGALTWLLQRPTFHLPHAP